MPDTPVNTSPSAKSEEQLPGKRSSPDKPALSSGRLSDWSGYAALAVAVIAVILAALAYFQSTHHKSSLVQQSGDAKANVCSAYKAVHRSVVVNTHMTAPRPDDPVAELAVATNARLALIGGGAYLKDRLEANTAAPADLANTANSFADTMEQLGTNYLLGAGAADQDPLRHDLDSQIEQLDKMCS